ncbi:MAG: glycosyltransferase family 2 protein [Clostridia bacterium]|nr:glycosyltransferase family 2 protein [Clostridia bacterium]
MAALTVFTPAYNRAHTLGRTYASLCAQTCKDFIWLIVDDGSQDETAALVQSWQQRDNGFAIEYIRKENGGMHTAHNVAYENIRTELNTCIDSDDRMPPDAVELILDKWEKVRKQGYAGLIALDADFDGNVIGKGFPEGMQETTLSGYYAGGGFGDKKLVYRTDVINSVPTYPVYEGEKYVALAYKYRLIDQQYKLAVLNRVVCEVEYQADGHSTGMWREYLRSPRGFAAWRRVCMQYPTSWKRLLVDCMHYVSSSILAGNRYFIEESPRKVWTVLCTPAGALLALAVRKRIRK